MRVVLKITFDEYETLENTMGNHVQYVEVPSTVKDVKYMGIHLGRVIVIPWGYSADYIKKYGKPVDMY